MAYTTKAKAAALAGAGLTATDIQDEWLVWADELIDNWRGDQYPPTAAARTDTLDGDGSDTIFLPVWPITSVSGVKLDSTTLAAADYVVYARKGYVRRGTSTSQYLGPYLANQAFDEGVGNVEITYIPVAYPDLLDAAAAQLVAALAKYTANGGLMSSGGWQVGDYSEKGGQLFGDQGLDGEIRAILETKLPRKRAVH